MSITREEEEDEDEEDEEEAAVEEAAIVPREEEPGLVGERKQLAEVTKRPDCGPPAALLGLSLPIITERLRVGGRELGRERG